MRRRQTINHFTRHYRVKIVSDDHLHDICHPLWPQENDLSQTRCTVVVQYETKTVHELECCGGFERNEQREREKEIDTDREKERQTENS